MNTIQLTIENFSSSTECRIGSKVGMKKKTITPINRPLFQETFSPMRIDNNNDVSISTQSESNVDTEDMFGLVRLPSILYTRTCFKKIAKTQTELPKIHITKKKNTSILPNQKKMNEKFIKMTNQEDIKDFDNYTNQCLEIIDLEKKLSDEDMKKSYNYSLTEADVSDIKTNKKKLAVFDLDETLSHCEMTDYYDSDALLKLNIMGQEKKFGLNMRPYLYECLKELKKNYVLVCFTASQQLYGETVLNHIDPHNEIFTYRLYRHHCVQVKFNEDLLKSQTIYIKDLRIFQQVCLSKIVIIDNSILSFAFQLNNGIPILPFYSRKTDEELKNLVVYMKHLALVEDVTVENGNMFSLEQRHENAKANRDNEDNDEEYEDEDTC